MNKMKVLNPKEKLFYLQEIIHSCELSTNEIAVYTTLIIFANNKTGKSFPSRKVIAERVNLSVRSVSRIISQLKERGLIEVKTGTNGKSNEYLFLHYSEIGSVLCMDDINDVDKNNSQFVDLINMQQKARIEQTHQIIELLAKKQGIKINIGFK